MKKLFLVALAAISVAHAQTRWQLATGYSAESFHTKNIEQFADEVAQATDGALQIDVHSDNSLFKLADIRQAVQDGKAEAGESIMTSMVDEIPIAGADAIPFVVHSYADARRLWQLQRPLIEKQFAARGMRPLYAVPWPPQGLFANVPVRTTGDLKGTRMRTYNQSTRRIAQMLGATPVDVPMADVNQALARREIDGMITSAVTGVENRVWGQIGFYYSIDAWFPKNIVLVNEQAFGALPSQVRSAVLQAAARAEGRGWAASEAVARESTRELQRHGVKVERAPAAFESELKRLGEKFSREWVQSVGKEANEIFVPYYLQR
ncbi:TRAP transporter substrate-binding protein [Hydrogenophaga sp.]|uniref:TRAP transporter substrate-binding protein n=1 Tax=Hydrogenophaga sp. TaxID=1904254 RepID=UPI003D0E73E3